jgi:hypothetical protein
MNNCNSKSGKLFYEDHKTVQNNAPVQKGQHQSKFFKTISFGLR